MRIESCPRIPPDRDFVLRLETFLLERMQSTWEHSVRYNLSESGMNPVSLADLADLGLDFEKLTSTPLGYSPTNGTVELRRAIAQHYPGASVDQIEVTNGTSEANFLVCLTLLGEGDEVLFELPNYLQVCGIPPMVRSSVRTFRLRADEKWEPDWDQFEKALSSKTRIVYVSNPNNPTGAVLSQKAMNRLVAAVEAADAFLIADEVYRGAELSGELTPSFWGMSDRVIVTSGLSKAFGIPGVRIGWIVGPPEFVADCWANHDYISIGPNMIGDMVAQVAMKKANSKKLFGRTHTLLRENLKVMKRWLDSFDGFFEYIEPQAGAFVFVKYQSDIASVDLAERIRRNQDVLVVPGAHFGMEGYLRISLGVERETLSAALVRIKNELETLRTPSPNAKP